MKVKELIEELKKHDPEADVFAFNEEYSHMALYWITKGEHPFDKSIAETYTVYIEVS